MQSPDIKRFVRKMQSETPGSKNVIHFNNAGSSLPTKNVLNATIKYLKKEASDGGYETQKSLSDELNVPYVALAKLLNCSSNEIAIVHNATDAWQKVFFSFKFENGDRIISTPIEYSSNYINFLQLQKRVNVIIDIVPETSSGDIDLEKLELEILKNPKPKLVSITHVPTNSGKIYDAIGIGKITTKHKVPYLLDACQSVGQIPVNIAEIGCDFLSGTSRKFLRGPRGVGFLYCKESLLQTIEPMPLDNYGSEWLSVSEFKMQPTAKRFEHYEMSFAAKYGFGIALTDLLEIGIEKISEYILNLADILRKKLSELPGVTVQDIGSNLGAIVSFTVDGKSALNVAEILSKYKINVAVSNKCSTLLDLGARDIAAVVRASLHVYNDENDINKFIKVIKDHVLK